MADPQDYTRELQARVAELEALLPLAREGAMNYTATELDEDYPGVRKTLGFLRDVSRESA